MVFAILLLGSLAALADPQCAPPCHSVPEVPEGLSRASSITATQAKCTSAQRDSVDLPPPTCCTPGMMIEIRALRSQALNRVQSALGALAKPDALATPLRRHFRIQPNDTVRLAVVRARLLEIQASLADANGVAYLCRDQMDATCGFGNRRAATDTALRPALPTRCFARATTRIGISQATAG